MKKLKEILLLLSLCLLLSAAHAKNFLSYTFQRNDSNSLAVTLSFQGNASGQSFILLPDHWANQDKLYQAISGLIALSSNAQIKPTEKPEQFSVTYKPNSKVQIRYILRKDWSGPLQYPLYFRLVVEDNFFYFEGFSGLVYPQIKDDDKIDCELAFKGFSNKDFIGNSYFSNALEKKFTTTLRDLRNSIFCGGAYRYKDVTYNGNKIVIALSGNFMFDDDAYFSSLSQMIISEKTFWNDFKTPYFFTMLLPMQDKGNTGGTAHYNSFAAFQSSNLQLQQGLNYIISHEFFHTWIGQGLRMPDPEELSKWFQEGFTDYYAYKNLRNTQLITGRAYLEKLNEILVSYYVSQNFNTPNNALVGNYWRNPSLKQLSYQRGLVLALLIDEYLSKNTKFSLDDVMRELYSESKPGFVFSKDTFFRILGKYGAKDLEAIIEHVNNGENSELAAALKQSSRCAIKDTIVKRRFDLGFNINDSRNQKKIVGLNSGSNAALAGLKEGMEITGGFSIWNNNTEKTAKVQVVVNGSKQWIEFLPVAEINQDVPQLVIPE